MQNLGGKQSVLWAIGKWSIPIRRIKESIPLGIFVVMMINTINYKLGNDKAY